MARLSAWLEERDSIFEALTAKDRLHKEGMGLEPALSILKRFSRNGHVDAADLHEVFVEREIFRRYA